MLRLQQQQMLLRSKLDRVYERTQMERHERAGPSYGAAGLQILELAQSAYSSYLAKNPHEQARLRKTFVSNSTFVEMRELFPSAFSTIMKRLSSWLVAYLRSDVFFVPMMARL